MEATKQAQQDPMVAFRSSLEDAIAVCQKLASHCGSVEDLVEMLNLALENDSQCKWLMSLVVAKKFTPK